MNHSSSLEANPYVNLTSAACPGLTVKPEISTHGLLEHLRQPSAGEQLLAKPLLQFSDPARAAKEHSPLSGGSSWAFAASILPSVLLCTIPWEMG